MVVDVTEVNKFFHVIITFITVALIFVAPHRFSRVALFSLSVFFVLFPFKAQAFHGLDATVKLEFPFVFEVVYSFISCAEARALLLAADLRQLFQQAIP